MCLSCTSSTTKGANKESMTTPLRSSEDGAWVRGQTKNTRQGGQSQKTTRAHTAHIYICTCCSRYCVYLKSYIPFGAYAAGACDTLRIALQFNNELQSNNACLRRRQKDTCSTSDHNNSTRAARLFRDSPSLNAVRSPPKLLTEIQTHTKRGIV